MIALIVAYARNRVIGNKGCIPWKIKGEQRKFKELTTGNVVIMGRRTYEEIGRPLPNRKTIVVSSTMKFDGGCGDFPNSAKKAIDATTGGSKNEDGTGQLKEVQSHDNIDSNNEYGTQLCVASSLGEAIELAGNRDIYISGGAGLYAEGIDLVDKMYITEIEAKIEGDVFFPDFDEELFDKKIGEHFDGEIPYTYIEYTRRN